MDPDLAYEEQFAPFLKRRRRQIALVGAIVAFVWAGLALMQLRSARDQALDGVTHLESVRNSLSVDSLTGGELTAALAEASSDFDAANKAIRSPLVAPLRLVPWVGTQVRSADALSSTAGRVSSALALAANDVARLADDAAEMDRVAVARQALSIVQRTRESFGEVDLGPSRWLMRSLADARDRVETELDEATALLADAEAAGLGLAEFLEGPTTYLLLAANNSEMGAGSGSYLQVGTVEVVNGVLAVDELLPAGDILLERGAVEIPDPDLDALWSWLDIAVDWRNLSPSPRFPANAELAASMWAELQGENVDGVLVLDPIALSAILGTSGAVDVDGRTIAAEDVVRELLFDQYWEDDVAVRRDRLDEIAHAALGTLDESGIDLVSLARSLQDTVAGRHILAWSPHPQQQAAWEAVGADGDMTSESLAVSVINRGANKLDTFLEVEAKLDFESAGDGHQVALTVTLDNRASAAFPTYVLGPAASLGYEPGTYSGLLAVTLPGAAAQPAFAESGSEATSGPDGPGRVISVFVEIPAGQRLVHRVSFGLPSTVAGLRIEPSARVPGIDWTAAGSSWIDTATTTMDLASLTVAGSPIDDPSDASEFNLDPIRNPVAPIPVLGVDPDVETTVTVAWPDLPTTRMVDVWERPGDSDWVLVGRDLSVAKLHLPGRQREVEYCYRTALHDAPERFSAVECLVVPPSLGFMRFNGDGDDYFSADDFISEGDLDIRVLVAPDRWTPAFWQMFAGQYDTAINQRAWRFGIDVFDSLIANFSTDGFGDMGENGRLPLSVRDGSRSWMRVTIEMSEGRLRYWVSEDGVAWTQLGDDRSFRPAGPLHDTSGPVFVGSDRPRSDTPFDGKLYYLEIREGVDGRVLSNLDFRDPDQMGETEASWADDHGNVFTATGSGWEYHPPES
ncbi:MAG: DUF4012 domain-containing protein [Acidimicrobiia bacterium]